KRKQQKKGIKSSGKRERKRIASNPFRPGQPSAVDHVWPTLSVTTSLWLAPRRFSAPKHPSHQTFEENCRALISVRIDCNNLALIVVLQLSDFHCPQVSHTFGQRGVVVEKVPFAVNFTDRVVSCPTHDGGQNSATVGEGTVNIITNGVAQQVRITG